MSKPLSEELLSAYLDGELTPAEKSEVERSLEAAPKLRERLEDLAEVGQAIRSLPRPGAPSDLRRQVLAEISQRTRRAVSPASYSTRPSRRHVWQWIGALVAACVVVGAVAIWSVGGRRPGEAVIAH